MHQLNDPWTEVLNQFYGCGIGKNKIFLHPSGKNWKIQIIADYDIHKWAETILLDWNNVNPVRNDLILEHYEFNNRRDAEKFVTLFNLTWAQ